MTFSILARDPETGVLGGGAATGSLCVGGWVLRGRADKGLSASQGSSPSTLWGEQVLDAMAGGAPADAAVMQVTGADPGRGERQLAALDISGGTHAFTGENSIPWAGSRAAPQIVAAGNMLTGPEVIPAALEGFAQASGDMAVRLLAALEAAERAGGDNRGLLSAALLVVARDAPPLSLRIDHAPDRAPLRALRALHAETRREPYSGWLSNVPTLDAPHRA